MLLVDLILNVKKFLENGTMAVFANKNAHVDPLCRMIQTILQSKYSIHVPQRVLKHAVQHWTSREPPHRYSG